MQAAACNWEPWSPPRHPWLTTRVSGPVPDPTTSPNKRLILRTADRCEESVGSACGTCDAHISTPWDTHDPPPSGPSPQGGVLVVDVDATLWHRGLSWWAAWTAGGMVERPPPPDEQPQRARVWDIFLSLLSSLSL